MKFLNIFIITIKINQQHSVMSINKDFLLSKPLQISMHMGEANLRYPISKLPYFNLKRLSLVIIWSPPFSLDKKYNIFHACFNTEGISPPEKETEREKDATPFGIFFYGAHVLWVKKG